MIADRSPAGRLADGISYVQVPNPHGRSGQPTNVYIIGAHRVSIIDAGADDGGVTVLSALERFHVAHLREIVLTHAHHDHAGGVRSIQAATGAIVAMHPASLVALEHFKVDVVPDRLLNHGDVLEIDEFRLHVYETPGHAPGHVSLYEPSLRALFAGDLLSGSGTIAVTPPLGSMSQYLASLRLVSALEIDVIYPGHGPVIPNGNQRITEYINHRERRALDIFQAIASGYDTLETITARLYPDVQPRLRGAARGTVHAHVQQLFDERSVYLVEDNGDIANARFGVTAGISISAEHKTTTVREGR